jgi:mRNA deadenylase 3'-5' endonuclease subunit Ccr4
VLLIFNWSGVYRNVTVTNVCVASTLRCQFAGVLMLWDSRQWQMDPACMHEISYSTAVLDADIEQRSTERLCLWQGAIVGVLSHTTSRRRVAFANTHISCRWREPYVQLMQIHSLLTGIERVLGTDVSTVPVVMSGDFNVQPWTGGYDLVVKGAVSRDHEWVQAAIAPTDGSMPVTLPTTSPSHSLCLRSSYATVLGSELPFTNYALRSDHGVFSGTLDYLFYSPKMLVPIAVLAGVTEDDAKSEGALPNRMNPSDHIPLMTEFAFK